MKILTTLALLLSVSPLAAGCMAPTGDESTKSSDNALMNNGDGVDPDRSEDDLKRDGWDCGPIDGVDVCTKRGTNTVYYCYPSGMCTAAPLIAQPPPHKGVIFPRPIVGPINALQ